MWNLRIHSVCIVILCEVIITPCASFKYTFEKSNVQCDDGPRTCDNDYPYRSIDGSCNNLKHLTWGMAVIRYKRIIPNRYADGIHEFPKSTSGKDLPLARRISIVMNKVGNMTSKRFTNALMQFGQFIAHDGSRTGEVRQLGEDRSVECCKNGGPGKHFKHPRCAPIIHPKNDPVFKIKCTDFERTATTKDHRCSNEKQLSEPLTVVTGFFDLSLVYGSNDKLARSLRTLSKGLMKTVERHCQAWPPQVDSVADVCFHTQPSEPCFQGGDVRINQSPQLTSIHVMFLRLHNKVAKELSRINNHWGDEKLYQEARKICIGYYQHIVYNEYLPRILGEEYTEDKIRYSNAETCIDDYNSRIDPSILVEFATGAYRSLHSTIVGYLQLVDQDRDVVGTLRLSSNLNMPKVIQKIDKDGGTCGKCLNYDNLLTSMSYQPQEKNDKYFDVEVKQFLFRDDDELGIDLRAFDIQRDRDHGVGSWVSARKFCKLEVPRSFSDLPKFMSEDNARKLSNLYEHVNDIDLSVGGLAENVKKPSLVGPTFLCILRLQFYRSRVGDRFFYENCEPNSFTNSQLNEIHKASLACLMCDTSNCIKKMQPNAFDLLDQSNKLVSCNKLCNMNLKPWYDEEEYEEEHSHGYHGYSRCKRFI